MTEATKQGHQFPPPPIFGSSRPMNEDRIPHTGSICLDDIFDEFLFSGDRQSNASASSKVFDQYGKYTDNEDYFDDSGDDSEVRGVYAIYLWPYVYGTIYGRRDAHFAAVSAHTKVTCGRLSKNRTKKRCGETFFAYHHIKFMAIVDDTDSTI